MVFYYILTICVGIAAVVTAPFALTFVLSLVMCIVSILVLGLCCKLDRINSGRTIAQVARLSLLDIRQDVQNGIPFDDWMACKIIAYGFWCCFFSHEVSNRNKIRYCKCVLCYCTSKTWQLLYEASRLLAIVIVMAVYGAQSIAIACNQSVNKINCRQITIDSDIWYNKRMNVCKQEANEALLQILSI